MSQELEVAEMALDVTISLADVDITDADTMAPGVGEESTHKTVPNDLEGKTFGRLVAIRELAVGGMGRIVECFDPRLRRNVVVKVLRPFPKMETMHRARLTREARVTSQLQHAGIVPVHDIGETEDGELYYVMQKIEGCTLGDVLRGVRHGARDVVDKWTLFRLLSAFERICSAVAFAHHRRVIHRDIKPANIMLGPFDEVLVVDWGVVRLGEAPEVNAEASLQQPVNSDDDIWAETGPGLTVGTPRLHGSGTDHRRPRQHRSLVRRLQPRRRAVRDPLGTPALRRPQPRRGAGLVVARQRRGSVGRLALARGPARDRGDLREGDGFRPHRAVPGR